MTQELGKLIQGDGYRDAIHIAIAPAIAGERLSPGQHVGFNGKTAGPVKEPIGIVDPFLPGAVMSGERFWLLLYPNTITALRHEWTHPAFFEDTPVASPSHAWLLSYAKSTGLPYSELMDAARSYLSHGEYLCEGGRWEGVYVPDEFWPHFEAVTGSTVKEEERGSFFSCSC